MGGTCSTHGNKARDQSEENGIDDKKILIWILRKQDPMADSSENDNEPSC
jgi:hypothetical protein